MSPTASLGPGSLGLLPSEMRPGFDAGAVGIGIVHLGIGAFHRAHQAAYTDAAIAVGGGDWGICGVSPRGSATASRLAGQGGLYSLSERGVEGEVVRVVGSVREVRSLVQDADAIEARIAAPTTKVVSTTITEQGYREPAVALGCLLRGLRRRMEADAGPLTVLCCDNLPAGGVVLRETLGRICGADQAGQRLWDWVDTSVTFPSSMVDRVVPATTAADIERAGRVLGLCDRAPVVAEPFHQWVLEDSFAAPRPAWERVGVELVDDVFPYEQIKLRALNGSHSALAYLGSLAGFETIAAAIGDDDLAALVDRLIRDEVAPTVDPPPGFDLAVYRRSVIARFANPAIRHLTRQVVADGSRKLPLRLLPVIADSLTAGGRAPRIAALAVAAWMRSVSVGVSDVGGPLPLVDPLADELRAAVAGAAGAEAVTRLLGLEAIFEPRLAESTELRDALVYWYEALAADGTLATAAWAAQESRA